MHPPLEVSSPNMNANRLDGVEQEQTEPQMTEGPRSGSADASIGVLLKRKRKTEALNNNVDSAGIKTLLPKTLNVSEQKEGFTDQTTSIDMPIAGFVQNQRGFQRGRV